MVGRGTGAGGGGGGGISGFGMLIEKHMGSLLLPLKNVG